MQTGNDLLAREIAQPTITLTLAPWHTSPQFAGPGDDNEDLDDEDFEDLDDEDWEDDEDLDEDDEEEE